MITINGKVFEKVDTGTNWTTNNPVLENKQQGFDSTAKKFKVGDGVTAWNDLDYYYNNDIFIGSLVNIPSGSTLAGDGYFEIDYTPYIAGHGQNPGIFVLINKSSVENQLIYDVPVSSINDGSDLIAFRVYCHQDPSDPTKSIDNIVLLIK